MNWSDLAYEQAKCTMYFKQYLMCVYLFVTIILQGLIFIPWFYFVVFTGEIGENQHRGKTSAHAPNYENMAGNLNINF